MFLTTTESQEKEKGARLKPKFEAHTTLVRIVTQALTQATGAMRGVSSRLHHASAELLGGFNGLFRQMNVGSAGGKRRELVKVEVAVRVGSGGVDLVRVLHVFLHRRQAAQDGRHGRELGRSQEHVGTLAQAVGKVARRRRNNPRVILDTRLVAHAKRAAGHFSACTNATKDRVVALVNKLSLVHLGRGCNPEASGQLSLIAVKQLAGGAKVTNVGHARPNKHFLNRRLGNLGKQTGIIRIVGRAQNWLRQFVHVNLNDLGVSGLFVSLHKNGVLDPLLHAGNAALQSTQITIALGYHPLEHDNVGLEVFDNGFLVELDGAASGTAFGRGIGELKGLFALEVTEAFDFEDAARENVLLALLLHRQQAALNGLVRDGVHQVAQGNARLHRSSKPDQNRLGHVQRHHTSRSSKCNQARASGERNTNGKARVGVAASANRVGQKHAVNPRVDDAVTRAERHTATVADKVGQGVVSVNVHGLGVCGSVAKRLHDKVGLKAKAGKILELVTGHRASGVLGSDGGHLGFAVLAGDDAVDAAGGSDHLLGKGETLDVHVNLAGGTEHFRRTKAKRLAGTVGQPTANNQRNAASGPNLVKKNLGLWLKLDNDVVGAMGLDDAFVGVDVNDVAHVEVGDVHFEGQGARVFHGVVENGGNLAADADAAATLAGDVRDVVAHVPEERVGGRFAGRARADDVANVREGHTVGLGLLELGQGIANAVAGDLEHGKGVQRNVWARPGVGCRGEVVGVCLSGDLEHLDGNLFRNGLAVGKPLGIGPRLDDGLGDLVALPGLFLDVEKGVKHQNRLLEAGTGRLGELVVIEGIDQRGDVVPTLHGAEQLNGALARDPVDGLLALGHGGKKGGLDVGRLVDARGNALREQLEKSVALGLSQVRALELGNEVRHLRCRQRLWGQILGRPLGNVLVVRRGKRRLTPGRRHGERARKHVVVRRKAAARHAGCRRKRRQGSVAKGSRQHCRGKALCGSTHQHGSRSPQRRHGRL
eukprot:m.479023 g.479023  ORF g.479023 m.479023 type:complete len:993 (-) comp21304_c0_seq1:94-3072(-)